MKEETVKIFCGSRRYYNVYMRYVLPPVLLLGLLGNPLVVVVFAQRSVLVQSRLRFYYLLMAVCDWLFLLDWPLTGYLGDGLYLETGGAVYVYVEQLSVLWCKSLRAFFPWPKVITDWSKVCTQLGMCR